MIRSLILLLFFLITPSRTIASNFSNLLHISNEQPTINEKFFYLSSLKNKDSESNELERIYYSLSKSDQKKLQCQFPARFKELNFPTIGQCQKLENFRKSFKGRYVSIAFATEKITSLTSSFGHVFIVIHKEIQPELDSDVIHFSAKTNNEDGLYKYISSGINGKYKGFFFREKLFQKVDQYINKEQRYIFFHTIDPKMIDIQLLIDHLYELKGASSDYYFFQNNCSHQIDFIINSSLNNSIKSKSSIYKPLNLVKKYNEIYENISYITPTFNIVKDLSSKLSKDELRLVNKAINGDVETGKGNVSSTLFHYYYYLFKTGQETPNNFKDVMTNSMYSKDYDYTKKSPLYNPNDFSLRFGYNYNKTSKLQLGLSPLYKDMTSLLLYSPGDKIQKFLDLDFIVDDSISLKQLTLLELQSINNWDSLTKDLSWLFKSHFNESEYINEIGIGQGFKSFFNISYFLIYSAKYDNSKLESNLGLKLNILKKIEDHQFTFIATNFPVNNREYEYSLSFVSRLNINLHSNVNLIYSNESDASFLMSLNYYL